MQENTVYVKNYTEVYPINYREIWRYSGYHGIPEEDNLKGVLEEVIDDLKADLSYKVCFYRFPLNWENNKPLLPFECDSENLAKCLEGADEAVMFCATIGPLIDRKISINERFEKTKALLMQGYGAERVESVCDYFQDEIKEELCKIGRTVTARFSPGYGDMPLVHQKDFFKILDINHKIGVALTESLLMKPSKSVTAIFGIKDGVENKEGHKCENCLNKECEYRV